jgi:hypothetical protein
MEEFVREIMELRDSYQRKVDEVSKKLNDARYHDGFRNDRRITRLKAKRGCYRAFITELDRALRE